MKKRVRPFLGLLALLSLSSCALPPREAWRVIRHDGLIPYVAVELGHRPVPGYVHLPPVHDSRFIAVTSSSKAPRAVVAGRAPVFVNRHPALIADNRFLDSSSATAPKPKPPLAPAAAHVSPPSVPTHVQVTEMPKPKAAPRIVAAPPKPAPKPAPGIAETPKSKVPSAKPAREIPAAPKVAVKPKPPVESKPQPKLPPNPVPVPNPDRVVAKPAVTPPPSIDLPFGTPISGRPGLVNSPFAGKNQLVDVTGLAPGQEVKCPYSGKLFRVPGVQEAKADTKPALDAPPAKPKDKDGGAKP